MTDEQIICGLKKLVRKQKAKIERLKAEADMADGYADALAERAKAEARKEFAERVFALFPSDKNHTTISRFTVKQILKEMTEDEKNENN